MPRCGVPWTKQSADERVRLAVAFLFDQKQDSGGPASGDTFAFHPPGTLTWNLLPASQLQHIFLPAAVVLSLF